jgi:Sec7-like guanine-nucleotide exchange factor
MATTKATRIAAMVRALADNKPNDFSQAFQDEFDERLQSNNLKIQDSLKSHMFKSGEYSLNLNDLFNKEVKPSKDFDTVDNVEISDQTKDNKEDILGKYMNSLDQALSRYQHADKDDDNGDEQ